MRETGADRHRHGQLSGGDQLVDPVMEPLEERPTGLLVGLDEKGGELVTAHPAGEVGLAERVPQELGHPAEYAVALGMAERVVDLLELVEVEEDERDAVLVAARPFQLELQLARERLVVQQVGQLVVPRLVRELRGGSVEVGDDALCDEAVDRVVQAPLDEEDVFRAEPRAALGDEAPEHAAQEQELRDDVARGESERLPLARVVANERRKRAAAVEPLGPWLRQLPRELADEGRHVPELAQAPEP